MTDEGRAARYSDLFEEGHNHSSDCAYCPICATIAVVRKTKPEILDHLAAAAKELIIAAGILIDEASEVVAGDAKPRSVDDEDGPKIRRIDVG
ncbi:MAG: hypothetical protein QOG16_1605 [Actinomycetota bacterium]|nr:hypothetical protein [Actinomycetota bacterium]